MSQSFKIVEHSLPGCRELIPVIRTDPRGLFVKTFHAGEFEAAGLRTDFREQYYSVSRRDVLRGLHFQRPPHHHAKLVYCTEGTVLDVAVDLRLGSSAFGQHVAIELSAKNANMLYLPAGLAHGFLVLSERATMVYNVTSVYNQECDAGIGWNSVSIRWPATAPLLSERDAGLPAFSDFSSPFRFQDPSCQR